MTDAIDTPIRLLFLEDDRADVELATAMLTNAGLSIDLTAVDSREAFTGALSDGTFDLILSDYLLPTFDGLSALKIAKERSPDTPFIIVSGFLGEERAIDTLKSGATDYVLKQRLDRLLPAVERALREVRVRKAREEAQRERERLLERERHLAQRLRGMTEASLAIASALSLDDVLQLITNQAREVVGAHQAMTTLPVAGDWAHAVSSISLSDKYAAWRAASVKPDGSGLESLVSTTNRPVKLTEEEVRRHLLSQESRPAAENPLPMRGWLAAPLVEREGKNIGLIQLSDKYDGEFTDEDEAILIQLAHMASAAVQNARLYREAQEANRAKDDFIATLSHELRTPMTAILGWVQLLRYSENDEQEVGSAIEMIENSTRVQARIIEDLMDVSRIIVGKLHLESEAIELEPLVRAAERNFVGTLQERNLTYRTDIDNEPLSVWGDGTRLQQVVWNLLSNAIKFTPDGGSVSLSLRKSGDRALIRVSDTGQGISPEFIDHVFERFRQASDHSHHSPGLGLGLAIVRHLVEAHHGTVEVQSPGLGKGTTFTVSLPLSPVLESEVPKRSPEPPDLHGLNVLIVDDDQRAREMLTTTLNRFGATARAVASVAAALEELRTFAADIVISDIAMPGEDGYALIRKLRDLEPELGRGIPAMALTAYGRPEHHARIVSAGFQRYVQKPVDPEMLGQLIRELAGERR
jgi:signal transduction histidine kinase/DNA-binding response OmpR family regulator